MRIEKLTPEQENKLPDYVKKWVDIGLSNQDVSTEEAFDIVCDFREIIDLPKNVPMIWGNNPIECWVLSFLIEEGVKFEDLQSEMEKVFNGNPKKWEIPKATMPFNDISVHPTYGFYDYMINELNLPIDSKLLDKYNKWQRTSAIYAIYPLDKGTVICRKPLEIHLNERNDLHRDGGPALVFAGLGDFNVYALNGIAVPKYLAVTPAKDLDIQQYVNETNIDVKAEFIRKAGVEKFLSLGNLVDSYKNYAKDEYEWWHKSEYEVWDMQELFPTKSFAPYLKMLNPTTKVWHLEGVSPRCDTVEKAIKERFGGRSLKIISAA